MAVSSLVQMYGGNRMHAKKVGELLGKQGLIGIPFAGGLSELPYMNARQILVNDKYSLLFDLYFTIRTFPQVFEELVEHRLYHPNSIEQARAWLKSSSQTYRAVGFFIENWLTRCSGGTSYAGNGSLSMRWTSSGGSSIARWRSAVEGLPKWAELLRDKCECTCLDWRDFAVKWHDRKRHGLYLDPPWIGAGDDYVHKFGIVDHRDLASWAKSLTETTIVVRHSDCEQYRSLYRESDGWQWNTVDAKNQSGNKTGEVLIVRKPCG